jgi:hypothetical protein
LENESVYTPLYSAPLYCARLGFEEDALL